MASLQVAVMLILDLIVLRSCYLLLGGSEDALMELPFTKLFLSPTCWLIADFFMASYSHTGAVYGLGSCFHICCWFPLHVTVSHEQYTYIVLWLLNSATMSSEHGGARKERDDVRHPCAAAVREGLGYRRQSRRIISGVLTHACHCMISWPFFMICFQSDLYKKKMFPIRFFVPFFMYARDPFLSWADEWMICFSFWLLPQNPIPSETKDKSGGAFSPMWRRRTPPCDERNNLSRIKVLVVAVSDTVMTE